MRRKLIKVKGEKWSVEYFVKKCLDGLVKDGVIKSYRITEIEGRRVNIIG